MEVILKAAEGSAGPARLRGRCSMPPVKAFSDDTTIKYDMYKDRLQLRHGLAPTTTETLGLGLASSANSEPSDDPAHQMTTDEDGHLLQRRTSTNTPILLTACRFCSDLSCTSVASQNAKY
ncbi:hypothetical protein ElyMa_005034800 [Elysia marginata]|uniref:Uncharacterized protein n=1 Tax=Elysia marginata TaxID=1093978 RepID=A0AAV4J9T0_9GAST|nr:hypothetical protein ElyMa_005034800 [Elysia marginata]